jgi:hypothetical protein
MKSQAESRRRPAAKTKIKHIRKCLFQPISYTHDYINLMKEVVEKLKYATSVRVICAAYTGKEDTDKVYYNNGLAFHSFHAFFEKKCNGLGCSIGDIKTSDWYHFSYCRMAITVDVDISEQISADSELKQRTYFTVNKMTS